MIIIVEKFGKRGVIPPFVNGCEGSLAIGLSKLIASTVDKGVIAAAYKEAIDMACYWQIDNGHDPDPKAVRFEIKEGKVLYHSRSGTTYLLRNGLVIARAWEQGNEPHTILDATTSSVVEIPDTLSIGDYLIRRGKQKAPSGSRGREKENE